MPNNSKLRRKRKELEQGMRQYFVSTSKPPRYPKVVGRAPGVAKAARAKRTALRAVAKMNRRLEQIREAA